MKPGMQKTLDVIQASGLSDIDKCKIDRLLRLIGKSSREMDGHELRLAREAAGLSLHQAAKLAELNASELCDLENGDWEQGATSELAEIFDRLYGLGDDE